MLKNNYPWSSRRLFPHEKKSFWATKHHVTDVEIDTMFYQYHGLAINVDLASKVGAVPGGLVLKPQVWILANAILVS